MIKKRLITKQKAFQDWLRLIKKKKVNIRKIKHKSFIKRDFCDFTLSTIDTELLFKGKAYKRAIQLEGTSVVIVPLLYYNNSIKTILVSQFRAPLGDENLEFPSGASNFASLKKSAKQEIEEELGLKIPLKNIHRLNKKPIYMLPANNFSQVFYFFFKKIDKGFYKKVKNKSFGKFNEGEFIKLKIVDIKNLLNYTNSASVIIGQMLINEYEIL